MSEIYETEKLLAEYLLFHYGSDAEILPPEDSWPAGMTQALGFTQRTVSHFSSHPVPRGFDLGCAVGRSTFEMARTCGSVMGIDFSHAFIRAAAALCDGQSIPYHRLEEAGIRTLLTARAPADVSRENISFLQGDAMNLPADLGSFDRVHAANLICRLPEPLLLLDKLPSLVVPGGELVLATPCTWLEEYTPAENWPSGSTFDWLVSRLTPDFTLTKKTEEPFLIRETARKFQWTRSLVTVWKRTGPETANERE
jgi:putative 4-mercaptohistidine N1-methyltranferase